MDWRNSEEMGICDLTIRKSETGYIDRCSVPGQQGFVIWFTGLSGSGKSSIAKEIEKELNKMGKLVYRLDGDDLRQGLNSDLGFSERDRQENIRRVAEVAAIFHNVGFIILVSVISPHAKMREFARSRVPIERFLEIYVKADLETCIKRDPKGLYKKAINGQIQEFTGISSPYEEPQNPDLIIDTTYMSLVESSKKILDILSEKYFI